MGRIDLPDVPRDEDNLAAVSQINEYSMKVPKREREGLRERLSLVLPPLVTEHEEVRRGGFIPQVCIDGSWVAL